MTSVNTNIGANVAMANMLKVNKDFDQAIERLSSGLRINSAKDDAAGMAIASKMKSQITGLSQAVRNASDAQNLIDTTEGAHQEINNLLQRLRELAVQSANDTNTTLDRTFLKSEATALIAEIDRIASHTSWNGTAVMDGTFTTKQFQVGSTATQDIVVSIDDVSSSGIGSHQINGVAFAAATNTADETSISVTGHLGTAAAAFSAGDSVKDVAAAINADTSSTGVTATAVTRAKIDTSSAVGAITFTLTGDAAFAVSATITSTSDLRNIKDAINTGSGTTGITASMGSTNAEILLVHSGGEDIAITSFANATSGNDTLALTAMNYAGTAEVGSAATMTEGGTVTAAVVGQYQLDSVKAFSVVAGGTDHIASASTSSTLSNIASIDIGTTSGAESAITAIDGAIGKINLSRSDLGAVSNRLDSTVSNLTNIITNTQSSLANISDADFAAETSNMTKAQILSQAATSMLAQANASKQSVLALLQG